MVGWCSMGTFNDPCCMWAVGSWEQACWLLPQVPMATLSDSDHEVPPVHPRNEPPVLKKLRGDNNQAVPPNPNRFLVGWKMVEIGWGNYWRRSGFIDVYWCLLMFIDVYWCLLMFIDVYWCLLMFIVDLYPIIIIDVYCGSILLWFTSTLSHQPI